MPPAVVAAGIGLAGTLGGGLIASGAQKSAQKSQQRGNDQALQYQRERDAAADKRYERDYQDRQRALAAKDATRRAIAKHYGIDLGPAPGAPSWMNPGGQVLEGPRPANPLNPAGPPVGAPAPAGGFADLSGAMTQGLAPGGALTGPKPMDDGMGLVGGGPMAPGPTGPPEPTPDVSNWSDWSRYARL